MIDIEVPG